MPANKILLLTENTTDGPVTNVVARRVAEIPLDFTGKIILNYHQGVFQNVKGEMTLRWNPQELAPKEGLIK